MEAGFAGHVTAVKVRAGGNKLFDQSGWELGVTAGVVEGSKASNIPYILDKQVRGQQGGIQD
jgi:hypothetical protein